MPFSFLVFPFNGNFSKVVIEIGSCDIYHISNDTKRSPKSHAKANIE